MIDKLLELPHFFSTYTYANDLELLDVVINIFAAVVLKNSLSNREIEILRYYLKNGYKPETKLTITLDLNISKKNLDQINHQLQKKRCLIPHSKNYRLKEVNKQLIDLKNCFLNGQDIKKLYVIGFNKK